MIDKRIKKEQVIKAINDAKEAGIETMGYFMMFLPSETKEEIKETIRFAKSLPLDYAQFSLTVPYPDTRLFEFSKNMGQIKSYSSYSAHNGYSFVPAGFTEKQMKSLYRKAYLSFYLRPKRIAWFAKQFRKFNIKAAVKILLGRIE